MGIQRETLKAERGCAPTRLRQSIYRASAIKRDIRPLARLIAAALLGIEYNNLHYTLGFEGEVVAYVS